MGNAGSEQIKVLGQFAKNKNYTIAEVNGALCALYGYQNGVYDAKYECQHFGGKLYGIGPKDCVIGGEHYGKKKKEV